MAKAENIQDSPLAETPPDAFAQLSASDVLNMVSKAAQEASRKATGNETRDAFIAFNRSLIAQLGGNERQPIG